MNVRTFLKYFLLPTLALLLSLSSLSHTLWKEYKTNNLVVEQVLQGNRYAIEILAKYEKPSTLNRQILAEALKGNPYALKVLKIDEPIN